MPIKAIVQVSSKDNSCQVAWFELRRCGEGKSWWVALEPAYYKEKKLVRGKPYTARYLKRLSPFYLGLYTFDDLTRINFPNESPLNRWCLAFQESHIDNSSPPVEVHN